MPVPAVVRRWWRGRWRLLVAGLLLRCLTAGALPAAGILPAAGAQELSTAADLRVASLRAVYNNGKDPGETEKVDIWVYNAGPGTARGIRLRVPYTYRMVFDHVQLLSREIRSGDRPSEPPSGGWVNEVNQCAYDESDDSGNNPYSDTWLLVCPLRDLPARTLVKVQATFTMSPWNVFTDRRFTTWVTSDTTDPVADNDRDVYTITPNHNDDPDAYWQRPGRVDQLDDLEDAPSCDRGLPADTEVLVWSRSILDGTYWSRPVRIDAVRTGDLVGTMNTGSGGRTRGFALHKVTKVFKEERAAVALASMKVTGSPDGLGRTIRAAAGERFLIWREQSTPPVTALGYWRASRLWNSAPLFSWDREGRPGSVGITEVTTDKPAAMTLYNLEIDSVHNFQLAAGAFVHNGPPGCNNVNLAAAAAAASALQASISYHLRPRPPTAPPPPRRPGPPVLPVDVPRQDEDGTWLIYLYREDTPGVIAHMEEAVADRHPWRLTYDPDGAPARRRAALSGSPAFTQVLDVVSGPRQGAPVGMLDRDEYPPAVSAEGGASASVVYLDAEDNQRAGRLMGQQFRAYRMRPGDRFRFVIIEPDYSSVTFLGENTSPPGSATASPPPSAHRRPGAAQPADDRFPTPGSWGLALHDTRGAAVEVVTGRCADLAEHELPASLPTAAVARATDYLLQADCPVQAIVRGQREDVHEGYNPVPPGWRGGGLEGLVVYVT
ncbi:NucA/NucB deoxyribonuclease domain-containing protein [Streptomyces nondiastaticus]|uniref:NucA/NucB deoxyribonuclease domain-containing protein n=1 Tax=Streptomyces nondiastaticus TaxID=3154512 RepID=UPI0034377419